MTKRSSGRTIKRFPRSRRVIVDVGKVVSRRPVIRGLIDADITDVRDRLKAEGISLTAYLVATLGRAVGEHPDMQALRDVRGRLVVFDDVDVAVSIEVTLEGRSFPLSHLVKSAQQLSPAEITRQLDEVKASPTTSPSLSQDSAVRAYVALPGPVRRAGLRALYRMPDQHRRILGTVGVSAIGMFGSGGGWGLALPTHPTDLLVGGISTQQAADGTSRQMLDLTFSFDHDVIDGAPAARFVSRFRHLLESGAALDSP